MTITVDNKTMNLLIEDEKLQNLADQSRNKKYKLVNTETKLIIVGSITPKNVPFYYCSNNRMYNYIDKSLGINLFNDLRIKIKNHGLKEDIDVMVELLKKYGIAFIDVFDKVIRKDDGSKDEKIQYANIDYKSFQNVKKCNAKIVCNSEISKDIYFVISKKLKINNEYLEIPFFRGAIKKNDWLNLFSRTLKQ